MQVRLRWPQSAAADAVLVNQAAIVDGAGTGEGAAEAGLYLMLGHVAPPLFQGEDAARAFVEGAPGLEVDVRGAYYLPLVRAIELHNLLGAHLAMRGLRPQAPTVPGIGG